jgi:signal transduction histidine kinase
MSSDPAIRGASLVRLGRVLRQLRDRAGALQAYAELERLGSAVVSGQPAALLASQARCRLYEEARDTQNLRSEAAQLAQALSRGGWQIDRATFDLYRELLQKWGAALPMDAIARTEAAWQLQDAIYAGDFQVRGRRILQEEGLSIFAVWNSGLEHPAAWLGTAADLEALLSPLWKPEHVAVSLYDTDGQLLLGNAHAGGISLTPGETHLPFILSVTSLEQPGGGLSRRATLFGGLAGSLLLMLIAAYGLYRVTTRELMLARQQSDFVSAVSHEFRTPLTSMRHLTELLVSRGVTSEERKTQYYELLAHETERLHRMVESLLSFGRIEVGEYAWHLEPADTNELVREIVEEFRREPQANGREVLFESEQHLPSIRADREALSRALWNLLENARKYSPPGTPIRIFAAHRNDSVLVSIEDEGAGIPSEERERIFHKFVRGADAKRAGIRGVGIGLALVKRIVEAHGGLVQLESTPGRGSKFTVVLPCHGF